MKTGVRQMAFYLWQKYQLVAQSEIRLCGFRPGGSGNFLEKIDSGLMGVVLKRMMMRAAATVAES